MRLQDALQAFLLQLSADGRSPHTIRQYRRHVTVLIAWITAMGLSAEVTDLTPEILARFFSDGAARNSCHGGPKKAVSLNAMRTSIRCFCGHLHDAGLVSANPARLLRRARCAPPPPRALHADEEGRLLEVLAAATGPLAERDRLLVQLLLKTGLRIGSALGVDVEDLDFAHGEITLRKTKNDRPAIVLMPRAIADALCLFLGDRASGPVFRAGDRRISIRQSQRRISVWLAKARIYGRSAHALRHTFATRIYASTGDLQLTQAALGHASIASTCIYAEMDRTRLREAVGVCVWLDSRNTRRGNDRC